LGIGFRVGALVRVSGYRIRERERCYYYYYYYYYYLPLLLPTTTYYY
jgi:hypothetical protein